MRSASKAASIHNARSRLDQRHSENMTRVSLHTAVPGRTMMASCGHGAKEYMCKQTLLHYKNHSHKYLTCVWYDSYHGCYRSGGPVVCRSMVVSTLTQLPYLPVSYETRLCEYPQEEGKCILPSIPPPPLSQQKSSAFDLRVCGQVAH